MDPITIMVVEDEAISAMSLVRAINIFGLKTCKLAATGEDAIDIARQEKPNLILMDILLAGKMDGIEAASIIRAKADIPIIFMTGYMEKEMSKRIRKIENASLLVKPIEPKDVRKAISAALDGRVT